MFGRIVSEVTEGGVYSWGVRHVPIGTLRVGDFVSF